MNGLVSQIHLVVAYIVNESFLLMHCNIVDSRIISDTCPVAAFSGALTEVTVV